jgi:2-methylcitrate dehydratase PrpD
VQPATSASVSTLLGAFVASGSTSDIPDRVKHQGRRAILNGIGTALCSAQDPAVAAAARAMSALSGRAEAGLIGRGERLAPAEAAFVNAIAINLLDFDDTHLPTVIHPTAPVAPVALALSEARGLSGAEVLAAFGLGAEIECRIGNMVSPGHYARGWHITSTCGAFGAAAAAARLLGFDAERTGHALGIAASLSSGNVENLPSAAKNASVGNAARNGILAAYLAAEGYTAAPRAIEGRLGWARASGDEPDVERALAGLGQAWEFERNAYKPYPCGIVFHAVIDACFELRKREALGADDIERVVVKGDALLLARGDRVVTNERDARVSLHHTAAVVFLYGAAGVAEFEPACVGAPRTVAFRSKIRGELDASLPSGGATVEVATRDGRTLSATVLHARGSAERPMSDADLEEKTRRLAAHGSPSCDIGCVIDLAWRIDQLRDVSQLMAALSPR